MADSLHLCTACAHEFATCPAQVTDTVFGIDRDPELRGEAADVVLAYSRYVRRERAEE